MHSLIAFTGRKRSGKDTAAKILIEEEGYQDVKMAGGLKAMLVAYFKHMGMVNHLAEAVVEEEDLKNKPTGYLMKSDNRKGAEIMAEALFKYMGVKPEYRSMLLKDERVSNIPIMELRNAVSPNQVLWSLEWWLNTYAKPGATPRLLMQTLGTEWGRDCIYSDVWIDLFKLQASQFERVVCTDVRFLNEESVIRELGGTIIKIDAEQRLGPNTDTHRSELEMGLIVADYVVENNGTLDDFLTNCREILKDHIDA